MTPTKSRIDVALPSNHMVLVGFTGSGKSSYLRKLPEFAKAKRRILWDPDKDHRVRHVATVSELLKACRAAGFGPIQVGLSCDPDPVLFGKFCEIAFAMCHAAAPLVIGVEELADVTSPAKAAPAWGQLARKVRKYGGTIYATTQRPQEIDKTILGQANAFWCGIQRTAADRKYMSGLLDVSPDELAKLQKLEYYLKVSNEPAKQGRVKF